MKFVKFVEIAIILIVLIGIVLVLVPLPGPPLIPPEESPISAISNSISMSFDGSKITTQKFAFEKGAIISENQFDTQFDLVFDNLNLNEDDFEIINTAENSQLIYLNSITKMVKASILCKSNGFEDVPSETFLIKEDVVKNCKETICCIVQFRRE